MIKMILKLLVLPIWLVLCLLSGLLDVVLRLYSLGGRDILYVPISLLNSCIG